MRTLLQKSALGIAAWQEEQAPSESSTTCPDKTMPHLQVPRSNAPLSMWCWRVWAQARPTLWRYGDAGNLDPRRNEAPYEVLLTHEWISCMCLREEMEYDLEADEVPFRVRCKDGEPEVNRFASDWVTLHLFATMYWLAERHQSAFAFLKNGGFQWAQKVKDLMPEDLASAARLHHGGGGLQALASNRQVPQKVRDALNCMQMAFAGVLGTDACEGTRVWHACPCVALP